MGDIILVDPKNLSISNKAYWPLGKIEQIFKEKKVDNKTINSSPFFLSTNTFGKTNMTESQEYTKENLQYRFGEIEFIDKVPRPHYGRRPKFDYNSKYFMQ